MKTILVVLFVAMCPASGICNEADGLDSKSDIMVLEIPTRRVNFLDDAKERQFQVYNTPSKTQRSVSSCTTEIHYLRKASISISINEKHVLTFRDKLNNILYLASLYIFLALPVILLSIRFFLPRWMPWEIMPIIVSILGWALVNATVFFYYEHLWSLIRTYGDNVPKALSDALVADGAKRVFALIFGWLYGIIYSLPFVMAYAVLVWIRKTLNLCSPNAK